MKYLILTASALALVACGNSTESEHAAIDHSKMDHSKMDHSKMSHDKMEKAGIETLGIKIASAYIAPPFPGRNVAGGFFKITNHGTDDRLVAVTSPVSASIEIHNHIQEDGVMKMRKVEGVPIGSGETIEFKPGSFHLMMYDAALPEDAKTVPVTFLYEKAAPMTLDMPIGDPQSKGMKPNKEMTHDKMDHSKMDH